LAILAIVLISYVFAQEITTASFTSPLFLWSNTKYFSAKNIQIRELVSTEDVQDAFLQNKRLTPISSFFQASSSPKVEAIVIFVEPKLNSEHVSILSNAYSNNVGGAFSHLKNLLDNSVSSLVAPYVYAGESNSIGSSVVLSLSNNLQAGAKVIIARSEGSTMLPDFKEKKNIDNISLQELQKLTSNNWSVLNNGVTDLIVVCFDAGEEVLNQEVRKEYASDDAFLEILDSFTKSGVNYVAAYTSEKSSSELQLVMPSSHPSMSAFEELHQQRRGNSIDQLFPAEIMQGLLFTLPLVIILFIGVCCTFGLQSALKFDAEKVKQR